MLGGLPPDVHRDYSNAVVERAKPSGSYRFTSLAQRISVLSELAKALIKAFKVFYYFIILFIFIFVLVMFWFCSGLHF